AVELIIAKQQAAAARLLKDFPDSGIQMIQGRWGPYLTRAGENYRSPKGADFENADEAQCVQWIEQAPPPKPGRFSAKSKAKNTTKPASKSAAKPATKPAAASKSKSASKSKPKA
ncbi:MAG: topoisomerase C-terminal repeat-containing protein, partial [Bacteroidota bacterium]